MSSLQHRWSPSGAWKVRNNDLEVLEILRERKAAIKSGRLKKRLFNLAESANVVGSGRNQEISFIDNWDGLVQEISEVKSVCSYDSDDEKENVESKEELLYPVRGSFSLSSSSSSSSSYICDECMEKEIVAEEGQKVAAMVVEASDKGKKRDENGVKNIWLAIGLIILSVIGIISMRSFTVNSYSDGNKVILVPT